MNELKIPVISERRMNRRFPVARAGKLYRRMTSRFVPAKSRDMSRGGSLLEVESDRPFTVGELIDFAVDYGNNAILRDEALRKGIVVRVRPIDERRQAVAVRNVDSQPVSLAA